MQALTPLLFAMLFPRAAIDPEADLPSPDSTLSSHDYQHESLLGRRSSSSTTRSSSSGSSRRGTGHFQDGYANHNMADHSPQYLSTKVRRHHSAGAAARRSATDPTSNRGDRHENGGDSGSGVSNIDNSSRSLQGRRASPPKRLSLDHAAFIQTFPMLDGLGDTSCRQMSNSEYYAPFLSHGAVAAGSASSRSRRRQHQQQSQQQQHSQDQEVIASSRSSTSSISSMVSDSSTVASTISSSSTSMREPLTPTRSTPTNYRSMLKTKVSQFTAATKDLITLHGFVDEDVVCASPLSNNSFEQDQQQQEEVHAGREQRQQLIAH